jgi:hypothetical protein
MMRDVVAIPSAARYLSTWGSAAIRSRPQLTWPALAGNGALSSMNTLDDVRIICRRNDAQTAFVLGVEW